MSLKKINLFFLLVNKKEKITRKTQQIRLKNKNILFQKFNFIVKFMVTLIFTSSNSFLNLKKNNKTFIYSVKNGKFKTLNNQVLKHFFKIIISNLKISEKIPTILSFVNAKYNYGWLIEKLSKHLFIPIIRFFKKISFNGCRKRKLKKK